MVVVREWARPQTVFTQGLSVAFGSLWESMGLYGASGIRQLGRDGSTPRWTGWLPDRMFGEGICPSPSGLWQLTWRESVAVRWDVSRRRISGEVGYDRDGWGACLSPLGVLTSDGSSELVVRDPFTLGVRRIVEITSAGRPVFGLNDLEWATGRIWANIYGLDCYVGIDPSDGSVTDLVDARELRVRATERATEVLNGLAYARSTASFYATGKGWPRLFEIDFAAADFDPLETFELPAAPTLRIVGGRRGMPG